MALETALVGRVLAGVAVAMALLLPHTAPIAFAIRHGSPVKSRRFLQVTGSVSQEGLWHNHCSLGQYSRVQHV